MFGDVMDPGIELVPAGGHMIPDYLPCDSFVRVTLDDRLDPAALPARIGILYEDNLYLTDDGGNIAFVDCRLRPTTPRRRSGRRIPSTAGSGARGRPTGTWTRAASAWRLGSIPASPWSRTVGGTMILT